MMYGTASTRTHLFRAWMDSHLGSTFTILLRTFSSFFDLSSFTIHLVFLRLSFPCLFYFLSSNLVLIASSSKTLRHNLRERLQLCV